MTAHFPLRRLKITPTSAWALGFLALAGCSTLPKEGPSAGALPETFQDMNAPAAATATATVDGLTDWWKGFKDPILDHLIAEALVDGGGPQLAIARVKESRAASWAAVTPYLPQFNLSLSAQGERVLQGPSLTGSLQSFAQGGALVREDQQATGAIAARIGWEVPLFSRIEATLLGGKANRLLSQADVDGARTTVAADVADAYLELRALQQRAAAFAEAFSAAESLANILKQAADAGLVAPVDAADARRQAQSVRAQSADVAIGVARAAARLAILRGKAPGADANAAWMSVQAVPTLAIQAAPAAPADLLRLRADVRLAEARALLAAADLGAARSDQFPQISLGGAIVANDNLIGSQLPERIVGLSLQPSISIPLFDWGARQAAVDIRDSRFQQALITYRDTVNAAVGEAQVALTQLTQSDTRLMAARDAENAAAYSARGLRASQEAGIASVTDRLRADQNLIEARLSRIAAEESQARAAVQVFRAFGGGPPALSIDAD